MDTDTDTAPTTPELDMRLDGLEQLVAPSTFWEGVWAGFKAGMGWT